MEQHKDVKLQLKQQQEFCFDYHLPYKYYKISSSTVLCITETLTKHYPYCLHKT